MTDIRLPNITARDTAGQLEQLKSYLFQMVQQLNYSMQTVQVGGQTALQAGNPAGSLPEEKKNAAANFNDVKALIIRSADIVNAYYDKINARLEGLYVAQSVFGEYREKTSGDISANSTAITQAYSNIQQITTDLEKLSNEQIAASAWIKSGLLEYDSYGAPVYGVEVGQQTEVDGVQVFNRYARFTAGGIYFYLPSSSVPVAWMTGSKLFITHAEITGSLRLGSQYDIDFSDGIAFKPKGG